jgi:hydroxymethylglutaryl-CoA lyase
MERSLATVALRTARRHYATHAADDRFVTVLECGPRDGLQNEKGSISTATKVELIKQLVDTGLRFLDVGAFVSPKWVPSQVKKLDPKA